MIDLQELIFSTKHPFFARLGAGSSARPRRMRQLGGTAVKDGLLKKD